MPPGAMVIHAVITIETSVMSGGMFIDSQKLDWHADYISFLVSNDRATNEYISADFPIIWQELYRRGQKELDEDQKVKLQRAHDRMLSLLSCDCARERKRKSKKKAKAECRRA